MINNNKNKHQRNPSTKKLNHFIPPINTNTTSTTTTNTTNKNFNNSNTNNINNINNIYNNNVTSSSQGNNVTSFRNTTKSIESNSQSQPPSSPSPDKWKRNHLRKLLENMLGISISQDNLPVIVAVHFQTIITRLMNQQIKLDSMERKNSFEFLKNQINSPQFQEYHFVKDTIVNHLIIVFGIDGYQFNQSTQSMPTKFSEEKNYDLTPRRQSVQPPKEQNNHLIELAPKLSKTGDAYFSLEFDSVTVVTRLFYDLIKTSKKFFNKMNIKIIYEKNGFENLDFTSLRLTLTRHKQLSSSAYKSFMKMKGIRNEWAHFVNPTTIPPHLINACFIFLREIFQHYQNITTPNSDAHKYIQRRIDLLSIFEKEYRIHESKPKVVSRIVAQFCKDPEKKKQSALKVIELLSEKLKKGGFQDEKQLDRLYNEVLLNFLPRSPYLLREMQQLNEKETPRTDMVFMLLENEFHMRTKLDEQYVKSFDGVSLSDQRFVSKSVFFKSIVMLLKNSNDQRKILYERSYHYYVLEKCLKSLKQHNFEEAIIQKFKQEKDINTPQDTYEMVLKQIDTQAEYFRNVWIAIANAFKSCCALEIPDAIRYLSWALTEMTMTNNFLFPPLIKPYIDLATNCIHKLNEQMLTQIVVVDKSLDTVKTAIRVCLESLLKFHHLSPELGQLLVLFRAHLQNIPHLVQYLDQRDLEILNIAPENVKKELLVQVSLRFSKLSKNDRANISLEGCTYFASFQEILDEKEAIDVSCLE